MSVKVKGAAQIDHFLATLPQNLAQNILRGALRAGAVVVADEAQTLTRSHEIRGSIKVGTSARRGEVTAKVQTKGEGAYLAPWAEYGTDPHFISVDGDASGGRTVRRVNKEVREGSLVINGKFVGATVHHPGARPYPFMRPALDAKEGAAVAAMQNYINTRLEKEGLTAPYVLQTDDE